MYPTVYWGELLRDLRVQHYMLQKEVAILLHISRQSYCNLENGRTQPTPEQLSALSFIYDVNLLDYVRKCIPSSFVAEQMAYRSIQSRRVYEVRMEEEEKQKKAASKPVRGNEPKKEAEKPEKKSGAENESVNYKGTGEEEISGLQADASSVTSIPVRVGRKKRDSPTMYHNTSNMSSVELLMSGKYPRPSKISEEALLGRFKEEEKPDVPKKKRGRPRKNRDEDDTSAGKKKDVPEHSDTESSAENKTSGKPSSAEYSSGVEKNVKEQPSAAGSGTGEHSAAEPSAGTGKEPSGPMPPEILRELFPQESPYSKEKY